MSYKTKFVQKVEVDVFPNIYAPEMFLNRSLWKIFPQNGPHKLKPRDQLVYDSLISHVDARVIEKARHWYVIKFSTVSILLLNNNHLFSTSVVLLSLYKPLLFFSYFIYKLNKPVLLDLIQVINEDNAFSTSNCKCFVMKRKLNEKRLNKR